MPQLAMCSWTETGGKLDGRTYIYIYIYIYIHIYIYIYTYKCIALSLSIHMYTPRGPTDLILRSKTHKLCSTYLFITVMLRSIISHKMQHVVGCPTWEHSHPNRCWVSKWEHGYSNRCSVSKMGTWLSKSTFYLIFQNGTWFSTSMLDFPHGNMICQVDVGFPKWERGVPNRCWMSIHTLGSNNGFKQWVQT